MPHKVEIIAGKSIHQDGIVEVSTSFLEEYFNVTRKTLTMWAEKGCPKLDRGRRLGFYRGIEMAGRAGLYRK